MPQLEFRVYRVQNEEKFLNGLSDLHDFGEAAAESYKEDIDEKTWLERFHDWKRNLFWRIKSFFRGQLSWDSRNALIERQSDLVTRSRIIGVAEFAQIPLLNDKQLVARWRQQVPPTFVSDSQLLPIDPLPSGMYLVEATDSHLKAYTVLLISRTALITRTVNGEMSAFVVDRKSGVPVSGAKVTLAKGKDAPLQQVTSADGITVFAAKRAAPKEAVAAAQEEGAEAGDTSSQKLWVMARSGDDVALVAPWFSMLQASGRSTYSGYAYTERPVYRPGDTVHFKAIVRQHVGTALALPTLKQVHVTAAGSDEKKVLDQTLTVSAMGTVEGSFELPKSAALSDYSLAIESTESDSITQATFLVEDYRKPEYQVRVSAAKPRVLQGESDTVTIDARYFFGEPVAGAKVKYRIFENTHYWWDEGDDADADTSADSGDSSDDSSVGAGDEDGEKTSTLNADGKLVVPIATSFDPKKHPDRDYVVEGAVTDDAGREITGRYHFLASYGSFRIHVEPLSYETTVGQPAAFRVTAVDYNNKPVQTAVHLHLFERKGYGEDAKEVPAGDADVTTGADGTGVVKTPVSLAGSISVVASAMSPEHRQLQDQTYLWVVGAGSDVYQWSASSQRAQIVADKKSYAPGDIAHLTLIGEVENFHALVTATGDAVEFRKVITAQGKSASFDVPITRDSQPNLVVDAVFIADNTLYQARKMLRVPPTQQQLQITVTPAAQTFQPQQSAVYDVTTNDSAGRPVAAEVSFGVVDEAIYALYPDQSGDIVKALYPTRQVYPNIENSLEYYFTGEAGSRSPLLAERRSRYRPQLAQVKPGNDVVQPKVRKAFPDTAFWNPTVKTDASGHARVTLTFPDSLTTWRATVRGITADSRAGSMVNRVIVRKNIIVRMGQPRFLRKGDTITVPVIVHNYLQQTKQVQVSLEAQGVDLLDGTTQSLTLPSRGEATVLYHLRASAVGTATLTAKALSTAESDALQVTLPVEPSGVQQTLAGSGILAGSGESTPAVRYPAGIDPATRSLQIQASPSIAGSMFSALDYLTSFPYGCTEQTMSSFLPNVIVAQAMQTLKLPPHGDPAILKAKIDAGLARLADYQHDDGGWGWWKEDQSQVFMTAYVVSGLAQARNAGYADSTSGSSQRGVAFLQQQLQQHPRMLPALRAYVVYALTESGSSNAKQLDTLWSRRSDLDAQALAYTGLAMLSAKDTRATEIGKLLESKANVSGDLASWPAGTNELLELDADASAEATAFVMKLLAHTDPQSPLLPKAAAWLVANRSEGYWWSSTQQTAFVIYGLTDYLMVSHELGSESDVEVFVDNVSAGKRHFTKQDAINGTALSLSLDASKLHDQPAIRIVAHGVGRTYWSLQANYFSTAKASYQSGSMALNIARDYFLLVPSQDKDGHLVYKLQPLNGPVSQGDTLAVHLGVFGSTTKYLLIEDPIPAGTEFLKRTDGYNIIGQPGGGWGDWFTRQEFHDDHAAIFSTSFDGRHDSFYLLKVINPGSFEISPARVMPMYQPGVQATTDELHLDVKEVGK